MKVLITRKSKSKDGTFGLLSINEDDKSFMCVTLELPDRNFDGIKNNEKGNSCIPKGIYTCKRRGSEIVKKAFGARKNNPTTVTEVQKRTMAALTYNGDTFEVQGVTCGESEGTRSAILIHTANVISELKGCIALGLNTGVIDGKNGILSSKPAYFKFMCLLDGIDEFQLEVREAL